MSIKGRCPISDDRLAGEIFQPRLLYCSPIVGFTVNVPKKVESFNSPVGGISEPRSLFCRIDLPVATLDFQKRIARSESTLNAGIAFGRVERNLRKSQ